MMQKQESKTETLDHKELLQQLEALAERNPEAGAILQLVMSVLTIPVNNVRTQSLSKNMTSR